MYDSFTTYLFKFPFSSNNTVVYLLLVVSNYSSTKCREVFYSWAVLQYFSELCLRAKNPMHLGSMSDS